MIQVTLRDSAFAQHEPMKRSEGSLSNRSAGETCVTP